MNDKEKSLAANLLNIASDEFGNHGCNDVSEQVFKDWSLNERQKFVKEFHEWNGDPDEYNENFLHIPDLCINGLFSI